MTNVQHMNIAMLASAVVLVLQGCSGRQSGSQQLVALDIPFEQALSAGQIERTSFPLGSVARPLIRRKQIRFSSDPITLDGPAVLWGAVGATSVLSPKADRRKAGYVDRIKFRIEAHGASSSLTLLAKTSGVDFPLDQWYPLRLELPTALGSPMRLEFTAELPPGTAYLTPRAAPVWAVPRLLRPASKPLPNVLLVVFDTLRADKTGFYGYGRETTPFLDRLAALGVSCDDLIVPYPSTLTSHWSLFTGLDPPRHGAYPGTRTQSKREFRNTLSGAFRKAGYLTAAFTEGGFVHSFFGFSQGFDLYHNGEGASFEDFSGTARNTFARAAAWIREHRRSTFFLFLHTYQVHAPYTPPEKYRSLFDPDYEGRWASSYSASAAREINSRQTRVTPAERAHLRALYDAEIRYLDDQFEAFWHELEELGVLTNTLVVITSDHGEDLLEHGWIHHGTTLYDPALRVPFLLIWPEKVPAGIRLHCQRPLVDVMPTLLELVGIPVPEKIDGRSFAEEIQLGACNESRPAYAELRDIGLASGREVHQDRPIIALRDDGWKLITHPASGKTELYNLTSDPGEQQDLAEAEPTRVQKMRSMIASYRATSRVVRDPALKLSPELEEQLRSLGYLD